MSPIRPWRKVGETEIADRKVLKMKAQQLESPRTGRIGDFTVLECPDWCNVVALTDQGQVVMVRQHRHGTNDVTLELPGGMLDPEDESPLEGAVRELREETGYAGTEARLIGRIAPNPAMQTNQCYTALVLHCTRVGELQLDQGEDIEVELVPYREIPTRIARGDITHALVVVAFAWALGLREISP